MVERLKLMKMLHETVLVRLPTASERVFLTPEGRPFPWHSANLMRIFDRLLERAGIAKVDTTGEKLDIHALRHTCASRLARAGVDLNRAQRLLGHSDPKLTAQVYTHVDAEDLRPAIEAMPKLGATTADDRRAKEAR